MRIVLDTNVLIAAFVSRGTCHELLEHCAIRHRVVLSPFLIAEFRTALVRKFRFPASEADEAAGLLESRFENVTPPPLRESVCRDPDDDHVIAAAVTAACECIVTGDRDLPDLRAVSGVRIVSPSEFWAFEAG
jgi:putative PIN family toxin of toxin-antitoxin system